MHRFSDDQLVILRDFERLCDIYGPSIKFLYSLNIDRGISVQDMTHPLRLWMSELINMCNDNETIRVIESVPVSSHIRAVIVSPFLNRSNDFKSLSAVLLSIGLHEEFVNLLKYPTTSRTIFDMSLYAKWYNNGKINYVSAPKKKWEIIKGAGNEMLPLLTWGIKKSKPVIAIPVSRYQFSKRRGLYYNQAERQYEGTFFYFEPDSPAYLLFEYDILISPNKIYAFRLLGWDFQRLYESAVDLQFDRVLNQDFEGRKRLDVVCEELKEHFGYDVITFLELLQLFYDIPSITYPSARFKRAWWSVEDVFDQLLNNACIDGGVNAVLMTRMAGYSRHICELLLTDDRPSIFRTMRLVA